MLDSINPFLGPERGDLRAGIIASLIANVNRDAKKKPQPFTPVDFMPFAKEPERPQTPADHLALMKIINAAQG